MPSHTEARRTGPARSLTAAILVTALALTGSASAQTVLRGGDALSGGGAKRIEVPKAQRNQTAPAQAKADVSAGTGFASRARGALSSLFNKPAAIGAAAGTAVGATAEAQGGPEMSANASGSASGAPGLLSPPVPGVMPDLTIPEDASLLAKATAISILSEQALSRASAFGALQAESNAIIAAEARARRLAEEAAAEGRPPTPLQALQMELGPPERSATPYEVSMAQIAQPAAGASDRPRGIFDGLLDRFRD